MIFTINWCRISSINSMSSQFMSKFQNPFTLRLRLLCDSKASSPRLVSMCFFYDSSVTKMASLHSFFISKIIKLPSLGIQSPCQMMIRVYNHLLSIVFRFHYRSQKVIGSQGHVCGWKKPSVEGFRYYRRHG